MGCRSQRHNITMRLLFATALAAILCACGQPKRPFTANPAAEGFDHQGSDPKAIAIADAVMTAQGGRGAYDAVRYLSWNFFGYRTLVWDKATGNVRIDWLKKKQSVVVNIQNNTGQVTLNGVLQTQPDTLAKYLKIGREVWINDSYWLVMPFKLKDSGVTLKYIGEGKTEGGLDADILQMTFKGVGVTPDNKYHVWVDKTSKLVRQWAFFAKFGDEKPQFTSPWDDYFTASPIPIQLSTSRGGPEGSLKPVETPLTVAAGTFLLK
jgi:hypothetical protein